MENLFKDKTVLITGGTGFLGRSLVRRILPLGPKSIRVYSRDEVKHHHFQEEFSKEWDLTRCFVGDVRDYPRLKRAVRGVDIVIHAAALKRLDLLEYNVEEAIKTNIEGTLNVVRACLENDVESAVFVSTDKACSPVNTYGACKFVGERIFSESNFSKGDRKTKFTVVRYGNVMDSTGSVIPFFIDKIKNKEPIPLTDPRMTRFIISPDQAVDLIFDALTNSVGGEVFVPQLPAFKVTDLIDILKERFKADNKIVDIGIRPGEKIHEIMINSAEVPLTYKLKRLLVVTSQIHKYHDDISYPYVKEENKIKDGEMFEYSSKDNVIPKEEVKKILIDLGLI